MWLITPRGFFSAVQKPGDAAAEMLTIRGRAKADLENLKDLLPDAVPYQVKGYSDYPWRIRVSQKDWAMATAAMSLEIDYSNFKDEVTRTQGKDRHDIYSQIWGVLLQVDPTYKKASYGFGGTYGNTFKSRTWKEGDRIWDRFKKKAATVQSDKKDKLTILYDGETVPVKLTVRSDAQPLRVVGQRVFDSFMGEHGEITSMDPLVVLYEDGKFSDKSVLLTDLDDPIEDTGDDEDLFVPKQIPQTTGGTQPTLFPELDQGTRTNSRSTSRSSAKRKQWAVGDRVWHKVEKRAGAVARDGEQGAVDVYFDDDPQGDFKSCRRIDLAAERKPGGKAATRKGGGRGARQGR